MERLLWPALFALILAYGLSLLHGGYLHYEGQFFLGSHFDGRGFFQQVFSAHFNNWDCYQPRELSFLFGLIDSRAIALGARLGVPFLYSVTSVVSIFVSAVLLWIFIRRTAPQLSATDSGLLVALMLVTPAMELSGYYYRPAKALVALFLVMTARQARRLARNEGGRRESVDAFLLFIFAALMAWSDLVGPFFIVMSIVVLAGTAGVRGRSVRLAHFALLAALAAHVVWRSALGPRLAGVADGIAPATAQESVPLGYTFGQFQHYAYALSLWLDNVGHFFGSSGAIGGTIALALMVVAIIRRPTSGADKKRRRILLLVVTSGLLFASYIVMYAKLTSIAWPESRLVYYWIPSMVVITMVAALAIDSAFAVSTSMRAPVSLALGIMICTSVLSLPREAEVIRSGEQRVVIAESGRVRDCMRSFEDPVAGYRLTAAGARACSSVRVAAFGSAGPGPAVEAAVANPLLWCRRARQ